MHRRSAVAGLLVSVLPALGAAEPDLEAAVRAWAGSAVPRDGRVKLLIAELVENGNAVPVTVRVDSAMTPAEHVTEIALFNQRNPQRDVARFQLGPQNGRAEVSTRIRLATTQQIVALARLNDGSVWQQRVDVLVTLAACVEG
ncbi:MAG TPA: SoxY-related AACIE arm protein [Rubrivivax sp.]